MLDIGDRHVTVVSFTTEAGTSKLAKRQKGTTPLSDMILEMLDAMVNVTKVPPVIGPSVGYTPVILLKGKTFIRKFVEMKS
jgi:hypothetical protein